MFDDLLKNTISEIKKYKNKSNTKNNILNLLDIVSRYSIFQARLTDLYTISKLEKLGAKGQIANLLGALIVRPDGAPKLVKDNGAKEDFS